MFFSYFCIAVFILAVTFVGGFQTETYVRMEPCSSTNVAGYTFRFDGVQERQGPNYRAGIGTVSVLRGDRVVEVMHPEKRIYNASGMAMTEAAIDPGFTRDLYVSLGEPVGEKGWIVRVYYKPFVNWIWGGCILMALGGLLAISDRRYRFRRESKSAEQPASPPLPRSRDGRLATETRRS
jgi:cytochrome c-type biogenesis protein CcmF